MEANCSMHLLWKDRSHSCLAQYGRNISAEKYRYTTLGLPVKPFLVAFLVFNPSLDLPWVAPLYSNRFFFRETAVNAFLLAEPIVPDGGTRPNHCFESLSRSRASWAEHAIRRRLEQANSQGIERWTFQNWLRPSKCSHMK